MTMNKYVWNIFQYVSTWITIDIHSAEEWFFVLFSETTECSISSQ